MNNEMEMSLERCGSGRVGLKNSYTFWEMRSGCGVRRDGVVQADTGNSVELHFHNHLKIMEL